jgi:outer membrane lipoprotein SlyB
VVRHTRSTKHSVEIIGGSTIGGALVGGLVGGKKGAVIGGLVGGGAGTVYDRKTRHKVRRE